MFSLGWLFAYGFMIALLSVVAIIAIYVISALGIYRVLTIVGYANPWMAWVPYLNYYALADAACAKRESMPLFGQEINQYVYKFWWVGAFILGFIPHIGTIINIAIRIIFLGRIFIEMFARIENKRLEDVQAIGYVSGFITIIGFCKFLTYDKNLRVNPNPFNIQ